MTGLSRSNAYWKRYWRILGRLEPEARSAGDLFIDRIVETKPQGLWLDAGCGRRTFPTWRRSDEARVRDSGARIIGCDADRSAVREREDLDRVCIALLDRLPFPAETFSLVTSNMVFEHLEHPEVVVAEISRVTRRGGRILVHTVNGLHYLALVARMTPLSFHQWVVRKTEGRRDVEVYPTRYRANTEARLDALFEAHGCRKVFGGSVSDLPPCVPYPGLFSLALAAGLLERQLAQIRGLDSLLRPNLLVEFIRC